MTDAIATRMVLLVEAKVWTVHRTQDGPTILDTEFGMVPVPAGHDLQIEERADGVCEMRFVPGELSEVDVTRRGEATDEARN